jgi:hypothetical protein
MKQITMIAKVLVALLLPFGVVHATIWYVHPDSALNSIQAGIDLCSTGDTVLVGPGTYVENINFNGMAITVKSEHGRDTTIIDGSSPANPDTGTVVTFDSGEDTTSVLDGFTLTNGTGTLEPGYGHIGGGILCNYNSSPIITNNIITGNTATYGGGIDCGYGSSPSIIGNVISTCSTSASAAGIDLYDDCSPSIMNNVIIGNDAGSAGGGIQCYDNCSPHITANTIMNNTAATWGGGIRASLNSSPTIRNNHIAENQALDGGGIICDGGNNSSPLIVHNTITNNIATNYGGGIECDLNARPIIDSCLISYNSGDEIYCYNGGSPIIYYNDIIDTVGFALFNADPGVTVDADSNYWGHSSGPYHPTANPSGQGGAVSDYVDFDPWLHSHGIEELNPSVPVALVLKVSPNPFRRHTNIRWQITDDRQNIEYSRVKIRIYDASGRLVRDFAQSSGIGYQSSVQWDGHDDQSRRLGSGVYFVRLQAGDQSVTEKLLFIR